MKRIISSLRVAALLAALFLPHAGFAFEIHAVPVQQSVHTLAGVYKVEVDDGAGHNLTTVDVNHHWVNYPVKGVATQHTNVYYAHFSFGGGSARVKVTLNSFLPSVPTNTFTTVLSPTSAAIPVTPDPTAHNVIYFTLTGPRYVMLKVNDTNPANHTYPYYLIIAADPLETGVPNPTGTGVYNITAAPYSAPNNYTGNAQDGLQKAVKAAADYNQNTTGHPRATVYVPAGVYRMGKATDWISTSGAAASHVDLYLAPGAVLRMDPATAPWADPSRCLRFNSVMDVKIFGRGTIDCAGVDFGGNASSKFIKNVHYNLAAAMQIMDSSQVTVDGIVLRESTGWMFMTDRCDHVTQTNLKVINYAQDPGNYREDDGIDLLQCQYSTVKHCLVFTADDACCLKGAFSAGDVGGGTALEHVLQCNYSDLLIFSQETALKYGLQAYADITESYFKNIDIVFAARALGVNAWRGGATWDKLAFADIRCEQVGSHPFDFTIHQKYGDPAEQSYSNVAQLSVVDFTCANFGASSSDLNGYAAAGGTPAGNFDRVTFGNVKIAGAANAALTYDDAHIEKTQLDVPGTIEATNVQFLATSDQLRPNGVALAGTGSSNWKASPNSITAINDNNPSTEAQATDHNPATVTYNFVSDTAFNHARVTKDNGTYSAASWMLERWDQHLETPAWVLVFDQPCTTDGPNDVYFSTVIGTAVRITFRPYTTIGTPPVPGSVGINQAEVFGVKLQ